MMSTPLSYSEGASLPPTAPQWAIAASKRLQQRRNNGYKNDLQIPDGVKKVLLHSCCAPCSGAMVSNGEIDVKCCFAVLFSAILATSDMQFDCLGWIYMLNVALIISLIQLLRSRKCVLPTN